MPANDKLRFKVAPHLFDDLGLNLYTSLPRVLVEFIANAHDADSPDVEITMDFEEIDLARKKMKAQYEIEKAQAEAAKLDGQEIKVVPLDGRTLPDDVQILIEDHGHGMSRDDLDAKFLVAGRRRRDEEPTGPRSEGGRLVMGRKGVGKLAGFGVARHVTVITRRMGEAHATKIELNYDELVKKRDTNEIEIEDIRLEDGGGIESHGTSIVLKRLVYEPSKSRETTVANAIADHFALIGNDFLIRMNEEPVEPAERELVYAFPKPELSQDELVSRTLEVDGKEISFQYRIRFTGPGQHLQARARGVRVYAHGRLASAPDLLGMPTGMHGFRQTDYMDGVVYADFVDEQPTEYISTDRQSLRWESPLLAPFHEFLSDQMKRAVDAYQRYRDKEAEKVTQEDPHTLAVINRISLPMRKKAFAFRMAAQLAGISQDGVQGDEYKQRLQILMDGLSQGSVLRAIADLAREDHPDINRLIARASELTRSEFDESIRFVEGRLDGIEALQKICRNQNFRESKKEKQLHQLFNSNPWLIDPSFAEYISSDERQDTVYERLARTLEVGHHAVDVREDDQKRPDLVFLLGSEGRRELVIVELKAPNVVLEMDHLTQLYGYMRKATTWLSERDFADTRVCGLLIGSVAEPSSRADGVEALRQALTQQGRAWDVVDILQLLDRTENAHRQLLGIYKGGAVGDAANPDEPAPEGSDEEIGDDEGRPVADIVDDGHSSPQAVQAAND